MRWEENEEKIRKAFSWKSQKEDFRKNWWVYLLIFSLLFCVWAYKHDTQKCQEVIANPCDYCSPYLDNKELLGQDNEYQAWDLKLVNITNGNKTK